MVVEVGTGKEEYCCPSEEVGVNTAAGPELVEEIGVAGEDVRDGKGGEVEDAEKEGRKEEEGKRDEEV